MGLVAVRHQGQRFAEVLRMFRRRHHRVADDVIGQTRMAQCAGIAQPVDDDRRGPPCRNAEAVIGRVAFEVDQQMRRDVDDALRGLRVRDWRQVVESPRHGGHTLGIAVLNRRVERQQVNVEPRRVVRFQHPGQQVHGGMIVKIRR